jgi:hypothetical protein
MKQAVEDAQFKSAMEKIQTPITDKDGGEFQTWWDADAVRLARVIQGIGKVETK